MQVFDLDSKIIVCIYRVYLLEIDHLTIYHIIMWDKENRNDTILPPLGIKWEHKQTKEQRKWESKREEL